MICVDFNQFVRSVWRRFGMYMCFAYTIMLIVSYKSWFRLVRVVFDHIHMHMPLQPDTCTSSPTLYSIQTKQIYVFQIYLACQTLWHFWMYFVYNSLHLEAKKREHESKTIHKIHQRNYHKRIKLNDGGGSNSGSGGGSGCGTRWQQATR